MLCFTCQRKFKISECVFIDKGEFNNPAVFCKECASKFICVYCHKNNLTADNFYEFVSFTCKRFVCKDCANHRMVHCHSCNTLIMPKDKFCVDNHYYCEHCFDKLFVLCDRCHKIVKNQEGLLYHDHIFCESCYKEYVACDSIHSYCYKPEPHFYSVLNEKRNTNLHIGVELEIQGLKRNDFILDLRNLLDDPFYLKEDGSLDDCYGVEIISHPMTYNYIKQSNFWFNLFQLLNKYNMNDTDNCGLHFHLDKKYLTDIKTIASMDWMINTHSDYFSKIGGRWFDDSHEYCKTVSKPMNDWGRAVDDERHIAVNLTNKNTVELRFFQSTYDYEIFMNRIKYAFCIAEFAKQYSIGRIWLLNNQQFENLFEDFKSQYFK